MKRTLEQESTQSAEKKQKLDETTPSAEKEANTEKGNSIPEEEPLEPLIPRSEYPCTHEVAFPPDYINEDDTIFNPPYPTEPARQYKFTLDPFQRLSVACVERRESVLVAAHTSAGKTVVAEYAIASSLQKAQRVIYTSPIKALSNQKYRELYEEYKDVGLMTGDITINPNASCLVMTTEILRSMLYRGSEIMREVAWVIFDEIHYMRDKERGVVWEETIILLPDKVKFVFLSATIPNAKEFAGWIAKIHSQPCHVVYTDYRPIPLQHYIFPANGDGLYLVVDEKGRFRDDNFQKSLAKLAPSDPTKRQPKRTGTSGASDIFKIVKVVMERQYDPVIIFSFSKRECEALALQMSKLDLNSEEEKSLVDSVFNNAIDTLDEDDKKLPQVANILPLLRRGIGIHHGGLLPLLKEIIEILFQEGLIKTLFATETFSIGLNMPAKTVVFANVRKFDGQAFRWISSGEYIQMSGRAGRRGLDDRGIVILMVDEKMEPAVVKNMVKGDPDPLISSFWLGYNMLLNLLRVEDIDPANLISQSFHQYQHDNSKPELQQKLKLLEYEYSQMIIENEKIIIDYYNIREQLQSFKDKTRMIIFQPEYVLPFLQPGRLVCVTDEQNSITDWWGVVINFQKLKEEETNKDKENISINTKTKYLIDCILPIKTKNKEENTEGGLEASSFTPVSVKDLGTEGCTMEVVPVVLELLSKMSPLRIYMPKDLRPLQNRQGVASSLKRVLEKYPDGIPQMDPIEDLKIKKNNVLSDLLRKTETLEYKLFQREDFKIEGIEAKYETYKTKVKTQQKIKKLKKQIKSSETLIMKEELKQMKRVLRRLDFTNSDDVINVKGRVACEITAGDELVVTELIFAGVFSELTVEQTVALLSCFVFDEKSDETTKLKDELGAPLRQLQESAKRVVKVSQDSKLVVDEQEYVSRFKPAMMDVCHAWVKGAKFSEICKMTETFEGSIIRCMRRLEELLRQLSQAAKSIGNTELEDKFADGITKIKRDIVFAASLYL